MTNMSHLLDLLFHNGIHKTKTAASPRGAKNSPRQGVVFAVQNKAYFTAHGVKGRIFTSEESLLQNSPSLSHFTPNVYRYGQYTDNRRRFIHGFTEQNLHQINTFVVDIDTKACTIQDILLECLDASIGTPTLIVESPRGYQVYFVLTEPLFISNKHNFRGLHVAKRIAHNIKSSLSAVHADMYCNDFGFFRLPTPDNVVWYQPEQTYTIAEAIAWSQRQDEFERPLYTVNRPSRAPAEQVTQSDWFHALINATDVKGQKGQIGRNNTLFTIALLCYQDGWDFGKTMDLLDEYNSRLHAPLTGAELYAVLRSAYSGKYSGASKEYVCALLNLYVPESHTFTVSLQKGKWYKFKKTREQRIRSHYDEWEEDLITFVTAQKKEDEPFLWLTQKELCQATGIPQSTLNQLIKKSKMLLVTTKGKGRGAKTGWTTRTLYIQYLLLKTRDALQQKNSNRNDVRKMLHTTIKQLQKTAAYEELLIIINDVIPIQTEQLRNTS